MGLIEVSDVEVAIGRVLEDPEASQVQYYIDAWSNYIETYTGTFFSPRVDEVHRFQADDAGLIDFNFGPVTAVTLIQTPLAVTLPSAKWDYMETIYNLCAHEVVDITLSYGYATAPDDIKHFTTQMVVQTMANPDGLTSYRVGDVTEGYTGTNTSGAATFQTVSTAVLDSYCRKEGTWRIGARHVPGTQLPLL